MWRFQLSRQYQAEKVECLLRSLPFLIYTEESIEGILKAPFGSECGFRAVDFTLLVSGPQLELLCSRHNR